LVVAIVLFLLEKGPFVTVLCVVAMFGLLIHPMLHLPWVKDGLPKRFRALCALGIALVVCVAFGWFVRPPPHTESVDQIADVFSKAVSQLGDKYEPVRIGAIHSMERLAKHSPKDRQMIVEMLVTILKKEASRNP